MRQQVHLSPENRKKQLCMQVETKTQVNTQKGGSLNVCPDIFGTQKQGKLSDGQTMASAWFINV